MQHSEKGLKASKELSRSNSLFLFAEILRIINFMKKIYPMLGCTQYVDTRKQKMSSPGFLALELKKENFLKAITLL